MSPPERAGTPGIRPEWVEGLPLTARAGDAVATVSGTGRVEAAPDRVRTHFAVETEAGTAAEAGETNARLTTTVTEALRRAGDGVPGFTLETVGYQVMPEYSPPRDGERRIVGYRARNTLRVVADDVNAAGPLIDAALEAGATRVAGLSFELSDPEPHRHRAVSEAIRQARAEAEVIAEALGLVLGPVISVNGGADGPVTIRPTAQMDVARLEAAPTPVEPGVQTVSATVTVQFRLVEGQ